MKQRFALVVVLAMLAAMCLPMAFAQATGSVKGVAKDTQGNPIADATVEWHNTDNGRKYTLKTNKKGEYFSLGIEPGKYQVILVVNGKQVDSVTNFPVQVDENILDFDEKKSQTQAAQQKGISPEQLKQMQEAEAKQKAEGNTVKTLNEKLAAANTAIQGGDFDGAINTLNEANQMDPSRDLLWAKLGDAYVASAPKQTDTAEKTRRYGEAVNDYQKAVDLKQKAMQGGTPKPDDPKILAAYYNNLAQAQAKSGKIDEAIKSYEQAAQQNPSGAAQYYYNEGAVMTNAGKVNEANAAFDKSIAADPNKADAYYQKGVNLINKATTDPKTGKVVAVPGTEEALNKYLELQPNGPYAEGAKSMLQYIGSNIETSFGKKKATKK